jgi:uncharacterized protein YerC
MTVYEIHVLTGDFSKPIKRLLKATLQDLQNYLSDFDDQAECSLIIRDINTLNKITTMEIFFGTKESLIKRYRTDCLL